VGERDGEPLDVAASVLAVFQGGEPARWDAGGAEAGAGDGAGHRRDRVGITAAAHRDGHRLLDAVCPAAGHHRDRDGGGS
jgi:hypothetical protein